MLELRDRSRFLDVTVEMLDGWRRHLSGRNASLIAFFGFLSIFPLALAAATVLGIVLDGNEDLQRRVTEGAFDDIPLIGQNLKANPDPGGNVFVLIGGLAGALWSSTKAFVAIHSAQDDSWEVDVDDRSTTPKVRGRALLGIVILGGAQIGSLVLAGIVSAASLPAFGDLGIIAATVFVNIVSTLLIFRLLVSISPPWPQLVLGAVIAGVIITALQHFNTALALYFQRNAASTYGDFAVVLGLVTWLSLMAIASLMCVELNAARTRLADRDAVRRGERFDLAIPAP
ncbi:MAG: YihY/virulence factor BrkB family protein [Actinomycetota bacterium]